VRLLFVCVELGDTVKRIHSTRHSWVNAALALLLIYAALRSVADSATTSLGYDEILTRIVSTRGGWNDIVGALLKGADGQPALFYLIERFASQIIARDEIALRLPSILALECTLICVFFYAKRRSGEMAGLICAISLLTTVLFHFYATSARPYSMVVACFAFALVCYQCIPTPYWVIAMGATFGLAESLHYYAVFCVLPFTAAELVFSIRTRCIRWLVWASFCCALVPLFLGRRILANLKTMYGAHFWSTYDLSSLPGTYGAFFLTHGVFGVMLAVVCAAIVIHARFANRNPSSSEKCLTADPVEGTLLLGFLLLPLTTFAATKLLGGTMLYRYVLPAILGMALAISCLRSINRATGVMILAFLTVPIGVSEVSFWRSVNSLRADNPSRAVETFVQKWDHSDLPVVIPDGLLYLPVEFYASSQWKERFVYLVDEQRSIQYTGTDNIDKEMVPLREYLPAAAMPSFSEFLRAHPEFLLYERNPGTRFEWLPGYLRSAEFSMELLGESENQRLYIVHVKKRE
jgi:hypothetical protein